jgi:hypothetical protein
VDQNLPCQSAVHVGQPRRVVRLADIGLGVVDLNGMITNDKFCLTRQGALELSWWRRPLRLRNTAD